MFNKEQITLVRQAIIDGVEDARNNGVNCGYPNCFTIEETHDGKTISVSYPLFSNEPDFDIEAPKPIY